jgi:SHS2 domain-containing protein
MEYEYLDHTADIKIRAYGRDFSEVLVNCAKALCNIMVDVKNINYVYEKTFEIDYTKDESLVYDFLSEILFYMDSEGLFLCDGSIVFEKNKLKAVMRGDLIKNYETHGDVKAVTYNDMSIEKNEKGYIITVVLDI